MTAPMITRGSTSPTVPRRRRRLHGEPPRGGRSHVGTAETVAEVRVGISGWAYKGWRGDFYPRGLPQRHELEYAAGRLTSIELNGSFYSLQKPESYRKWRDQTPDDFVFAVKGSRFITHMKRLADAEGPLKKFIDSGVFE